MKKLLYRLDEVAELLSMSKSKVYDLLREGKLRAHNDTPGSKGLRIHADSINEYIERYTIPTEHFQV